MLDVPPPFSVENSETIVFLGAMLGTAVDEEGIFNSFINKNIYFSQKHRN